VLQRVDVLVDDLQRCTSMSLNRALIEP
jgi:hypothetical protein